MVIGIARGGAAETRECTEPLGSVGLAARVNPRRRCATGSLDFPAQAWPLVWSSDLWRSHGWLSVGVVVGGGAVGHDDCCDSVGVEGDGGVVGVDPAVVVVADGDEVVHVCSSALVPVGDVVAVAVGDGCGAVGVEAGCVHGHECDALGGGVVALGSSDV